MTLAMLPPPEGQHALLLGDAQDAVHDALVLLVGGDLLAGMLHLLQQLDPLHPGHGCLGDGGSKASGQEVLVEGDGLFHPGGLGSLESQGWGGSRVEAPRGALSGGAADSALQLPPGLKQLGNSEVLESQSGSVNKSLFTGSTTSASRLEENDHEQTQFSGCR